MSHRACPSPVLGAPLHGSTARRNRSPPPSNPLWKVQAEVKKAATLQRRAEKRRDRELAEELSSEGSAGISDLPTDVLLCVFRVLDPVTLSRAVRTQENPSGSPSGNVPSRSLALSHSAREALFGLAAVRAHCSEPLGMSNRICSASFLPKFSHIYPSPLLKALVSSSWRAAAESDVFWERHYREVFSGEVRCAEFIGLDGMG